MNNQIIEIKDGGKYVLLCHKPLSDEELANLKSQWIKFMEEDRTMLLVLTDEFELKEISKNETHNETS